MLDDIDCLRCGTRMEEGLIADQTYGGLAEERWSAGTPEHHWYGLKVSADKAIPVTVMRCPKCGALESFAPPSESE